MAEKTKKNRITKRNILYAVWVVALIAVMATAIIVVASISDRNSNILDNSGTNTSDSTSESNSDSQPNTPDDGNGNQGEVPDDGNQGETPDDGNQGETPDDGNDQPVSGRITFIMPCANGTLIKDYTSDTVVFNSTLGAYMGHMGMDFSAQEGSDVLCVYDGVIESITTSYLTGTTVIVDHGNQLKTVYNSIEANEALYEGATVKQGAVLGSVSANNLQEYKDGAHLHFEVLVNGVKTDPDEYLIGEEK